MQMRELPDVMTPKEVASYLRVNINKAYELMHNPSFPSIQISPRRFIVSKDALVNWLNCQVTARTGQQALL